MTDDVPSIEIHASSTDVFPAGWYPDPWNVAPWRWWDGHQWTTRIYGPYGEAWPINSSTVPNHVPKGPGIAGGLFATVGAIVGVFSATFVAIVFVGFFGSNSLGANHPWSLLADEIPLWFGFVGASILASRINGSKSLVHDYGFSFPTLRDLREGVIGGLAGRIWPVAIALIVSSGEDPSATSHSSTRILGINPAGVTSWIILLFVTVFAAPVFEELFFRGLIQGTITRRLGPVPAIFLTGILFSLVHIVDEGFIAPVVLFPMALILGYLRHRTGRLAAGMVAHMTFNASIYLLFLFPVFR